MLNMKFQNDPSAKKQPLGKKLKVMKAVWTKLGPCKIAAVIAVGAGAGLVAGAITNLRK